MPSLEEKEVLGNLDEYPDMMQVEDIQEIFQIGNSAAYKLVKSEGFPGFAYRFDGPFPHQFPSGQRADSSRRLDYRT